MRAVADLALETLYNATQHLVRILIILAAAFVLVKIINRYLPRLHDKAISMMSKHGRGPDGEIEKRAVTLGAIFSKTVTVVIYSLAALMVLREAGFEIGPILASAGVAGLAIGFGAQNLVRDIIAGLFMLMENQIRLNDVVVVNGTAGLVEEINLRTTVLRSFDGTVHIFPNGSIQTLANMTREYSYYVIDVGVAYKEDPDRVMEVMRQVAEDLMADENYRPMILEPLEIAGVDRFAESAVIIKARIKTLPLKQWAVGREYNRRLKKRFDKEGIEIPFPQRTIHFATSAESQAAADAEDLRAKLGGSSQQDQCQGS